MKTAPFLAALAAAFLLSAPASAQSSGAISFGKPKAAESAEFVTIQAKGQGETVEAAKKDAARNAVKKAVGELVDAKTLVENDELVEDRILVLSNAMIEKADYGDAASIGDGLFEVPVTAVVKKGRLNQALKAVGIATGAVAGESLAAAMFTGKERIANAEKFFAERFKGFPGNVVEAVMLTNANGEPDVTVDTGTSHVFANVGVRVNMENYDAFAQALCELLDAVCLVKEDVLIPFRESSVGGRVYWGNSQQKGLDGENVEFSKRPEEADWHLNNPAKAVPVIVAHPSDKGLKRTTWPASVYYVDSQVFMAFARILRTQFGTLSGNVQVLLKDGDGSPVCSGKSQDHRLYIGNSYSGIDFAPLCCSMPTESRPNDVVQSHYLFLTPVLKHRFMRGIKNFSYDREIDPMLRIRIDLGEVSEGDLAEVAGYEVKVEYTKSRP